MYWSGALADLIVLLHFSFVLFVIFGGLLILKWRRVVWLHLPAVVWGAMIEFTGWICPLTPLENWLREFGDGNRYESGFLDHYVIPLLYPAHLTREWQILLGSAVIVINFTIYFVVFFQTRKSSFTRKKIL